MSSVYLSTFLYTLRCEYYSNLLFVVFVLVMGIVVMNLLVGLAVDDIKEIQENAELHQLSLNVSSMY